MDLDKRTKKKKKKKHFFKIEKKKIVIVKTSHTHAYNWSHSNDHCILSVLVVLAVDCLCSVVDMYTHAWEKLMNHQTY